jgi:hypothetical protein
MRIQSKGMAVLLTAFVVCCSVSFDASYAGGPCFPPASTQLGNPCPPAPPYCQPAPQPQARSCPMPQQPAYGTYPRKCTPPPLPEPTCSPRLVPVQFRDPGPVQPIMAHLTGLVGATVALPLRIAETLCPVPVKSCRPPVSACRPPQCAPRQMPACAPPPCAAPMPSCGAPAPYPPMLACEHGGPCVAHLPPCSPPSCGPQIPPALLREYEFAPLEPQALLTGLWNLPARMARGARFTGDVMKPAACGAGFGR